MSTAELSPSSADTSTVDASIGGGEANDAMSRAIANFQDDPASIAFEGRSVETKSVKEPTTSSAAAGETGTGAAAKEEYTPALLQRAATIGLTKDDLAEFGPTHAEKVVAKFERQAAATLAKTKESTPSAPTAPAPQVKKPDEPPALDPALYDETIIKRDQWQQQQLADLRKTVDQLQQQTKGVTEATQRQDRERTTAWLDGKFSELGEDFESVVGKGPGNQLVSTSSEMANRATIVNTMNALRMAFPGETHDQIFDRAVKATHGDVLLKREQTRISKAAEKAADQAVVRPNGKKAESGPTSEAELRRESNELYRKLEKRDGLS